MVQYIYFVKCPNCEDEHFDFFDEAKTFALSCLSQKPVITQTEVCRNDFGECTDSSDLGTVWSWEDECGDIKGGYTEAEPAKSIFTKDDLKQYVDDSEFSDDDFFFNHGLIESAATKISFKNTADYEEFIRLCSEIGIIDGADLKRFMEETEANDDNLLDKLREYKAELGPDFQIEECARKPIPEGMTIEDLVEEMEENEDTVECTWCEDLFDKSECRYEVDLGWLCSRCEAAIKSRGETLTFRENNYWDFLDEDIEKPVDEELEWHTYKITFSTKANPDNEQTTTFKTWQSDVEYAWRMSNANIPHTTIKNIELIETLEEADDYNKHFTACPDCGHKAYDINAGFCTSCGFN